MGCHRRSSQPGGTVGRRGLVDSLGWQWIFFVNVPVGIVALVLAVWLVPVLPTQLHQFDWIGVGLSGVGMFLIVFGLQEGSPPIGSHGSGR